MLALDQEFLTLDREIWALEYDFFTRDQEIQGKIKKSIAVEEIFRTQKFKNKKVQKKTLQY